MMGDVDVDGDDADDVDGDTRMPSQGKRGE